MQFAPPPCAGNKPFWSEDHNCHQNDAKYQVTNIAESETRYELGNTSIDGMQETGRISGYSIELCENKLVDRIDNERTNDHAWNTANTTNNHHSQVNHRVTKAKVIRRYATKFGSMIGTSDAREKGARSESEQFGINEIDTRRRSGNFILTDSDPRTA